MVQPKTVEVIRKQGRILTTELETIVKNESQFIQDLIGKSKTIHLLALVPVFILSVLVAIFLVLNVNRPLKTIENAIAIGDTPEKDITPAEELGIKTIVVASTSGETGVKAVKAFANHKVVVVTHSVGLKAPDVQELTP
ncbi:MAG: HAD hydrolase-like protein, partial [Deltaproteobacteria bacterium]|nr:HAD hydrolase-like protein [Deltaproteobacteria bacterium]